MTGARTPARAATPAPGVRHRQALLSALGVESSGYDAVRYTYAYGGPAVHTQGAFLVLPRREARGFVPRHGLAVLTVFAHRVKAIDYGKDSSRDRYLVALQSVRVAMPVPPLVMMTDDRNYRVGEPHALKYL